MVRERFIARSRRMALTVSFTAFLHGRVSKILSFKLRLSDPMSGEIRRVCDLASPSMFFGALIARDHVGEENMCKDWAETLTRKLSTQHDDLASRKRAPR